MLLALALGFAALLAGGPVKSDDGAWSIAETRGEVQVLRDGFQPIALSDGAALLPGDRVITKGNGRAVLTRGNDSIILAPFSEISLPAPSPPGWGIRILQEIGTIFLKVESSPERNFKVETPVLAAVVKGTRFNVTTNPAESVVRVREGAVQLLALDTGETATLRAGQTARLSTDPGSRIEIDASEPPAGGRAKPVEQARTERFQELSSSAPQSPENEEDETGPSRARTVAAIVSAIVVAAIGIPLVVSQAGTQVARVRKAKRNATAAQQPGEDSRDDGSSEGDDKTS